MLRVRGHGDALLARQVHVDGPTPADVDSRANEAMAAESSEA